MMILGVLMAPGLVFVQCAPATDSIRRSFDTSRWNRFETMFDRHPLSWRDRSLLSGKWIYRLATARNLPCLVRDRAKSSDPILD